MDSTRKRKTDEPASQLPSILGSTEQLNKNQKKKLRQKRTKLYKITAATIAAPTLATTLTEEQQQQHLPESQQEKRLKPNYPHITKQTNSCPEAVLSAEPHQQRPQSSHPSVLTSTTGAHESQQPCLETMPEPVYRTDMTHVARFLVAHNHQHQNGGQHAAPPQIIEDSSPAGSIHIGGDHGGRASPAPRNHEYLPLPTESAASAEDTLHPQQQQPNTRNINISNARNGGGNTIDILQTATPSAAPPLDLVAPIGPNGMRVYLHGNYHRYYGYRLGQEFSEDPRLALLERPWFAGKRCMDIGCNEGLVTLGIAMKFGSRSMVGVDIDEHLIKRACIHLREERSRAVVRAAESRHGGVSAAERRASRTAVSALAQTWFVHGDFLEARAEIGSIDCITALSVTKWIHLHRGDQGLRAFFSRVHSLLAPGGVFILEPQPWRSYRAAADKMRRQGGAELPLPADSFFRRVGELELRPDNFPEVLSEEFGFKLLRRLQPPEETAEGFDRHMFLFRKV